MNDYVYYEVKRIIITELGRTLLDTDTITRAQFKDNYDYLISKGFQEKHPWSGDTDLFLTDDDGILVVSFTKCLKTM